MKVVQPWGVVKEVAAWLTIVRPAFLREGRRRLNELALAWRGPESKIWRNGSSRMARASSATINPALGRGSWVGRKW